MYMLLNIDTIDKDDQLVNGTHIQWCCACNLEEASQCARETETANNGHIAVAVVDVAYSTTAVGRYYTKLKRLDT